MGERLFYGNKFSDKFQQIKGAKDILKRKRYPGEVRIYRCGKIYDNAAK